MFLIPYFENIHILSIPNSTGFHFLVVCFVSWVVHIKGPCERLKKAATQHKPFGHPPSTATKCVHLKITSQSDESQDNEKEDVESDEDKLYGWQVLDDDGLEDDAVARKS